MSHNESLEATRPDDQHPRRSGGAEATPPTPFNARSLRLGALDHLKAYRIFFTTDAVDSKGIEYELEDGKDGKFNISPSPLSFLILKQLRNHVDPSLIPG